MRVGCVVSDVEEAMNVRFDAQFLFIVACPAGTFTVTVEKPSFPVDGT